MVQDNPDPVIQRLIFGELARTFREEAGIDFSTADTALGGYAGKLSKIENGTLGVDATYADNMVALYKIKNVDADQLRASAAATRRRTYAGHVSTTSRRYVALERVATEIRMVYNEIPGLLQNSGFAYATMARSPVVPVGEARDHAEARAHRSKMIIRPDGPEVWIVLGMEALYREVGGPDVLCSQLERVAEIASMPNVRLRILPWSAGSIPGLGCPFTLLYVPPGRTIAYMASLTRPDYIRATGPYTVAFDQAWDLAVNEADSAEILKERITALS